MILTITSSDKKVFLGLKVTSRREVPSKLDHDLRTKKGDKTKFDTFWKGDNQGVTI